MLDHDKWRIEEMVDDQQPVADLVPETSPSLLLRIRDPSDRDSWLVFERIYGTVVRRYCRSWRLQPADVDDVVQEVMKTVAHSIGSFNYDPSKGRFRGWLGTITGNKIRRMLEREPRHAHISLNAELHQGSACVDPDDEWVTLFSEVILKEACSQAKTHFENRTWQCFELTWLKGESAESVARQLGVQISAVYVNKSRVLKRLEQIIHDLAGVMVFNSVIHPPKESGDSAHN